MKKQKYTPGCVWQSISQESCREKGEKVKNTQKPHKSWLSLVFRDDLQFQQHCPLRLYVNVDRVKFQSFG